MGCYGLLGDRSPSAHQRWRELEGSWRKCKEPWTGEAQVRPQEHEAPTIGQEGVAEVTRGQASSGDLPSQTAPCEIAP
jgi:hypothetical protein